ncbi:MAG TPA: TIGR03067 domain-containing protein [Steroidobacteraceae bacterium]|nr:TIGR03067 domain-containing protein [Steroidobacteraceae bacterium]
MRCIVAATLTGTWAPVAADISGRPLVVAQLRVAQLIIERDSYQIVDRSSAVVDSGALLLDEAAVPCAIDIVGSYGPHAGKRMRAIIELDGDRLRICYDLECDQRPASTRPQLDQLLLSITYVRAGGGAA